MSLSDLHAEGVTDLVSFDLGVQVAEARIIKLLEEHAETYLTTKEAIERELCEDWHTGFTDAIALIKDPTRNITSEILPDGSIHIEEVKGEK